VKVKAIEPDFSVTTMRLGQAVHAQLVASSRRSRERWGRLFADYKDEVAVVRAKSQAGEKTIQMPLVSQFISEWASHLDWRPRPSGCWDALGIEVPESFHSQLKRFGGVENFELLLGDTGTFVSATLGNNNHNLAFGLIINCPAWIELASDEKNSLQDSELKMEA
jgi:hypothetical protein